MAEIKKHVLQPSPFPQQPNPFLLPSQQGVHPMSPEAHPYVQSTWEQGTEAALDRGDYGAYNARVDQWNRQNPGVEPMVHVFADQRHLHRPDLDLAKFGPIGPFTSRGPITPPANTGGDPRAVSSYPQINEYMTRESPEGRALRVVPPANTGGDPRAVSSYPQINEYMTRDRSQVGDWDESPTRLRGMDTSGEQGTAGQRGDYGDKGFGYFGPDSTPQMVDPILIKQTPTPRTPAQIGDSVRMKAQTGQPLDAEERLAYSNHIRKGLQDAGKTEEEIQRALSRIDPATGMIPPWIR